MILSILAVTYVGISGALTLPEGDGHAGGAVMSVGTEVGEACALEAVMGGFDRSGMVGVRALAHFYGWGLYDRYFGFAAFDPFLIVGARGFIGHEDWHAVGPEIGAGAFYHFSEEWALRFDWAVMLDVDGELMTRHLLAVGVQYDF